MEALLISKLNSESLLVFKPQAQFDLYSICTTCVFEGGRGLSVPVELSQEVSLHQPRRLLSSVKTPRKAA